MKIKPIKIKTDHRATLKQVESLMTAKAGTPEGDILDILVTLIEAYHPRAMSLRDLNEFRGWSKP